MKEYESHCVENGKPCSHAAAKELLAFFSGTSVDRFIDTKGLDHIDKKEVRPSTERHLSEAAALDY
ncbi:hypothetical protein N7470_001226 [Penicillium chermesinum]|nr:hypothetical protein N7470_001226 [Penicillium chermesinum]